MRAGHRQLYSPGELSMYAITLIAELPVLLIRLLILSVILGIYALINGHAPATAWIYLPLVPFAWSVIALAAPIGTGWWWKQRLGGRQPSEREQLAYQDSVELLRGHAAAPLPLPHDWFVTDTPQPDAAVCGETLMLSRGLIESEHLPAVIAHELGHLATPDGRLTAAINRLLLWTPSQEPHNEPFPTLALLVRWIFRMIMFPIRGGIGLYATSLLWGHYWRGREYHADHYAATLGQADELADFLEIHALIHDQPVPMIWLTEHTHPPTELRVDRLRTAAHATTPAVEQESGKARPA